VPGDFFNEEDLEKHGWIKKDSLFISGQSGVKSLATSALNLLKENKKVLVNYESMACGGSEGYVSLYSKEREEKSEEPKEKFSRQVEARS
jgi:hypothetical protein